MTPHTCTYLQMVSMVLQLSNMTRTLELLKRPDGTKEFPSRSCCELKKQHPETKNGVYVCVCVCSCVCMCMFTNFTYGVPKHYLGFYWLDPNGGSPLDAFQVQCDYSDGGCATCIDAKKNGAKEGSRRVREEFDCTFNRHGCVVAF